MSKISKILLEIKKEINRTLAAKIKFAIIKLSITLKFNKFAFIKFNKIALIHLLIIFRFVLIKLLI